MATLRGIPGTGIPSLGLSTLVTPPSSTSESVLSGGDPASKTFSAFTDSGSEIDNYSATIVNAVGTTSIDSGSGLGPYAFTGYDDGDSFILKLDARNSDNDILGTAVHIIDIADSGGGGGSQVTPPATTSQSVAADGTPSNKTFSAFTDSGGAIDNYNASIINAVGSTSIDSGSGLGPYAVTGFSNGDAYVLKLDARDSSNNILATAIHVVDIGITDIIVTPPAPTTQTVAAGGSPSSKTFSAFTDVSGIIDNYDANIVNSAGSTSINTGSGLGAYTFAGFADGSSFVLTLDARDSSNNVLATAVHAVDIAVDTGVVAPAATTESVAVDGSPSNKTFSAFTDSSSLIDNYNATIVTVVGSTSIDSGSGLGPYAFTGSANGDSFVLKLDARDASNTVLATAIHAVDIGITDVIVTPPASTSQSVAADGTPSNKTFSAFTDPGGIIDNYNASIVNLIGSTSIDSGSGLGAYAVTGFANGDSYVLKLDARDSSNNILATAIHLVDIYPDTSLNFTAGADPTRQLLSSGTTSSSGITFNAPTGGQTPYSYSRTLHSDGGSSATVSGSGLGPYTVNSMADGEVHILELIATDDDGNQTSAFCSVAVEDVDPSSFADILNEDYQTVSGTNSINSNGSNALTSTENVNVSNSGVTTWEETTTGLDFFATSGEGGGPFTALHDDISGDMDYRDIIIYDMIFTIAASGLVENNDMFGLIMSPTNAQSSGAVRAVVRCDPSGNYQFNVGLRGASSWASADEFQLVAAASTTSAQNIRIRMVETRGEISLYADSGSTAAIPTTTLAGGLTYGRSYIFRDHADVVGTDHASGRYAGMYAVRGGGGGSQSEALLLSLHIQKLEAQIT